MMTRALPEGSFLPSRRSPLVAVGRRWSPLVAGIANASRPFLTCVLLSFYRSL
jgi:hypothetical protein